MHLHPWRFPVSCPVQNSYSHKTSIATRYRESTFYHANYPITREAACHSHNRTDEREPLHNTGPELSMFSRLSNPMCLLLLEDDASPWTPAIHMGDMNTVLGFGLVQPFGKCIGKHNISISVIVTLSFK